MADHDYFDNLLNTLPDAYQALARQGLYGDFFSFYLCDAVPQGQRQGRPTGVHQGGRPGTGTVHTEMKSFAERNPLIIGAVGLAVIAAVVAGGAEVRQAAVLSTGNDTTRPISPRPAD